MTRQPTRGPQRAQGLKLVISALAVAATVGGWAGLSAGDRAAAQAAPIAAAAAPPAWLREPPPIAALPELAGLAEGGAPPAAPPAAAPLRIVSAPAPITVTRSSR